MRIRKMILSDIPSVARIERECFGDEAWSENLLNGELDDFNKHYYVIEEDSLIVAYGGFMQVLDEGHINNVAVTESARKKGCATKILSEFFKIGGELGINSFTLEVRVGNNSARKLYEKMGFVNAGIRKKYYRNGDDCCIYWKYSEGVF